MLIGTTILPKPKDWNSEHFVLENYKEGMFGSVFQVRASANLVALSSSWSLGHIIWYLPTTGVDSSCKPGALSREVTGTQSPIWDLKSAVTWIQHKKISLSIDLFKVKSSNLFKNCLEGKIVTYISIYKELLSSKSKTIFTTLKKGSKVH